MMKLAGSCKLLKRPAIEVLVPYLGIPAEEPGACAWRHVEVRVVHDLLVQDKADVAVVGPEVRPDDAENVLVGADLSVTGALAPTAGHVFLDVPHMGLRSLLQDAPQIPDMGRLMRKLDHVCIQLCQHLLILLRNRCCVYIAQGLPECFDNSGIIPRCVRQCQRRSTRGHVGHGENHLNEVPDNLRKDHQDVHHGLPNAMKETLPTMGFAHAVESDFLLLFTGNLDMTRLLRPFMQLVARPRTDPIHDVCSAMTGVEEL
mmetsp:Transcript_20150/g.57087  ORF Transcript_20150/g.57087 Transcript_20150/m.57087 type:complete len:259 (+) Transcript_20150:739-1515(+)